MNEDKIIKKLIEHDERLENIEKKMATKDNTREIMCVLEDIATRVKRIDEDRVFSYQWIKRIEDRLESQEKDMLEVKQALKLA